MRRTLGLRAVRGAVALILCTVAGWMLASHLHDGRTVAGLPEAWAGETGGPAGEVVLTYGVGGVLTADGTLWQYRPDLDSWLTIDEAFRQEGRESTAVLPLPVSAEEIREMATWGFILTTSGDIWFYEIATDKWRRLKRPGSGQ